ncbi:MAG: tetratricopeptide repeat protein [Candidatus Omnitrophica bacterium]|nr:tetratricopeptide repeat protein [Candidatus Omnitrophota bacterium]
MRLPERCENMLKIIFAQIIVCFLLIRAVCGWCIEGDSAYDLYESGERLERLQIYFETEMYEEANDLLEELISEFPDEPKFKYLKAIVAYQRHDYAYAERVFAKFIEEYPGVAEPYYIMGDINLSTGNKDEARKYFMRYCELVPEDYDARGKLDSISISVRSGPTVIIKEGRENSELVKDIGFYGACVHQQEPQSIKLINGRFRTWSSIGIDFAYPIDLRGKTIVLELKGKRGGERLELTFRDKTAQGYNPQLMLRPEEKGLSCDWQQIKVALGQERPGIDLSCIVHMGLEFGSSTVQNPANSILFVKDISINSVLIRR